MDDPRYGTHGPETIPTLDLPSAHGRVLAGQVGALKGPFTTVQDVQIVDYVLSQGASILHTVPKHLDNCLVYVYRGEGEIASHKIAKHQIIRLDATDTDARDITLSTDQIEMRLIIFAGKKLNQPIAWRGPFVMTTNDELQVAMSEYRTGRFLKKRAAWDYKVQAATPQK